MTRELTPIKIRITKGTAGNNIYPAFASIPRARELMQGMKAGVYFDVHGIGMHYDWLSPFGVADQSEPGTPHQNDDPMTWYSGTCVPPEFADAVAGLDGVEILSGEAWEAFYDQRLHARDDVESIDIDALLKAKARIELESMPGAQTKPASAETMQRRREMFDPDHPRRGISRNLRRFWRDCEGVIGVSIAATPPL